jgi:hypothetical protein
MKRIYRPLYDLFWRDKEERVEEEPRKIEIKPKEGTRQACPVCLREFKIERPWQKFCSIKCRNDYHNSRLKNAANLNKK